MPVALSILGRELLRFGKVAPAGAIKIPAASPMSGLLSGFRASGSRGFPSERNKTERLAAYTGYVHTCANARAQRDGAAKYQIIDKRDGSVIHEDKLPIPYAFFRRPNPIMSEYYLSQLISLWLNLCGTAPVLKIRNAAGVPVMRWPLMPNRVTALYDPADWVRYEYQDYDGRIVKIPGRDVTFYRRPHPTKLFDGLGLLEGAGLFADTDALLWAFQRELFARGPSTQVILQYPKGVTLGDRAAPIAEAFEEIFSDREHPSYPAVLDQGVEAKAFPINNKGFEVPTINDEIKERIRSAFGTSRAILGETSAETFANAEGGERSFARFTETYLRLIDEENERSILPEWDERLTGDFESVTPADRSFALEQETARINSGVLTINEVREDEGWDKVPWGDEPRTGPAVAVTDAPPADDQDAPAPELPPTADVQARALNGAQVDSLDGIVGKVATGAMSKPTAAAFIAIAFPSVPAEQIAALLDGIVVKPPVPEPPTPPAKPGPAALSLAAGKDPAAIRLAKSRAFIAFQGKHEDKVFAALQQILAAEAKAIIKRVEQHAPKTMTMIAGCAGKKTARKVLADSPDLKKIVDMEEFAAEYSKLNPYLAQLYTEAGTKAAAGYGVTFEVDARGLKKIANHLHESTDAILQTTSEQIRAALEEGFLDGEGVEDLASRIRELYEGISAGRARVIARTETVAPANDGAMQGYKQAGVEKKEWIATEDELTRDTHAALDGVVIGINEEFKVGSDRMLYPGGGSVAGEVINCRCAVAGVVE